MVQLDAAAFSALMDRLAAAWAACDPPAAADCFTDDAVYMEPPDQQLFVGRAELEAFFGPLEPGTYFSIHGTWFDEAAQTGTVEFTFGMRGKATADHGIVRIELHDGRIATWREYWKNGPADFSEFTAAEGKTWIWHGGNYP